MKKLIASILGLFISSPALPSAALAAPAAASPSAAAPAASNPAAASAIVTTASGLRYADTAAGSGAVAASGQQVSVHYTGWMLEAGDKKGAKFDSSVDRGQPFSFALGAGQVIAGWDEGVAGMKVGGKRTLMIPAKLGYGAQAVGPIAANSNLMFDVELIATK